jgi:hypothetical protein
VNKSFNIQELLHCKSKDHETKPMHSSSSGAFQRDQECDLKHLNFGGSHHYKQNKTNKQPSFKDKYFITPQGGYIQMSLFKIFKQES